MVASNPGIIRFDGGILGEKLHARVDVPSYANAAGQMINFRPDIQGTMSRRPPLPHIDSFTDDALEGDLWPFYISVDDSYLVLATVDGARFYDNNDDLITIPVVTASLGSFTDESAAPANATTVGDLVYLDADGTNQAAAQKVITINEIGVLHVVAFEVVHGPMDVTIGTTAGGKDLMEWTRLRKGFHYLAFTPATATVYLRFSHEADAGRIVRDTVSILSGPDFEIPLPYSEADIRSVHKRQIRDVLYLTHAQYWARRLERRGDHSWSIVHFLPEDGPFKDPNITTTTIAANATSGEMTLTASGALFSANDVGVLYEMTGSGQAVEETATGDDVFSDGIKVTGLDKTDRSFIVQISGSFTATVTLQRSSGNENNYTDHKTYTAPTSVSIYDANDNQTWYYRLAVKGGDYTSGTITMGLTFPGGTTTGVVRVVQYTSATSVVAELVSESVLANTDPTRTWKRGAWNNDDGHPSSVTSGFGRLILAGKSDVWLSKSDDFTSFDAGDGDEADLSVTVRIASLSSDAVRWLSFMEQLVIGTASEEQLGLGNTNAEPVGPSNFQLLPSTKDGSLRVQPIEIGGSILFVHRSGRKLVQYTQNPRALSETSYVTVDLTARTPDLLEFDQIVDIAFQGEPEQRIFVVMSSGKLFELLFRREGDLDVVAWSKIQTKGRVERVCVLPRNNADKVYFITRRLSSGGVWKRAIERLGDERLHCVDELGHLDACVFYPLEKPETVAEVSGTSGDITITTDDDVFSAGDLGAVLWINDGRGDITAVSDARTVTVNVLTDLKNDEPASSGTWGFNQDMTTLTGLDHLEGQTVRVFGDLVELGEHTVTGGQVTLSQGVSFAVAGCEMRSRWQSLKLAYGAQKGSALTMPKAVKDLALLLYKTTGLRFGGTFGNMYDVPLRRASNNIGEPVWPYTGETDELGFDDGFKKDSRLCLEVVGAHPCTVSGIVPRLDEKDR